MASDYKKINIKSRINLSSIREQRGDKTHFIYELIQNADDSKSKRLELHLCEKELLVWNDGCKFREEDVLRISSIGFSDKDLTQIGNFGTGFKAVYNYTDRPEVYSGDERFCLPDPTDVSKTLADLASSSLIEGIDKVPPRIAELVEEGRTVFRLPFKENLRPEDLMLLKGQLRKLLKKRSLLFLPHLETIQWYDICDEQTGTYCRYPYGRIQSADQVELKASMSGKDPEFERFLVFSKKFQPRGCVIDELLQIEYDEEQRKRIQETGEKLQPIEVAFKLQDDRITSINNCVLFAYLPTEKETRLRFLIQARYQTNPARNDIEKTDQNPWNRWLIEATDNFLPEILEQLKDGGLLETTFFNVLPLEGEVENDFKPIAKALKGAMKERALIPTEKEGHYAKAKNVFYPNSTPLRKLVKSSGMHSDISLLHPHIRKDTKESGRCFDVMAEAGVKEIDETDLLCWLEEQSCKWFKNKTNKWLCSLYIYFNRKWSKSQLERIKELPLVRLENGEHVCVSDQLVYFPPETDEDLEDIKPLLNDLRILKSTLLRKEGYNDIKAFLRDIGVKKLRPENLISESICPLYRQADKPSVMKNRRHVRYIFKSWQKPQGSEHSRLEEVISAESERSRLEESVSEVPILRVYKGIQREVSDFVVPCDAYLPQAYTGDNDLETYFSVSDGDPWFVDDKYLTKNSDTKAWLQFLKAIGAMDTPRILEIEVDGSYEECKKRGISRQNTTWTGKEIIEDCELLSLPMVLHEISEHKNWHFSQSIWNLLVKKIDPLVESERDTFFRGTYFWKYRSNSSFQFDRFEATFYRQLKSIAWIPDEQGKFHKPSECYAPTSENRELLGDSVFYLPDSFNISTGTATWLAGQLGVRVKIDAKDVLKRLRDLSGTDVSVKDVEPLYRFLYANRPRRRVESVFSTGSYMADAIPPWRHAFKEESLIFIPEPKQRWWRTDKVFWDNEKKVFGDDCGYLEVHYGEHLKSFFRSSLEVPECAGTLHYIRGIKDIKTIGQAKLSDRKRLKILYRSLWMSLQKDSNWREDEEWIQVREDNCWLGKIGDEWGFFSPQELVWRDDDHRWELFKNEIPFWGFENDFLEFAKELGVKGCYQDSDVEFNYFGNQEKDTDWSAKVRNLAQDIYDFLNSPHLCGEHEEKKSTEVLTRLSVCRVEKLEVRFKLNGVAVLDPNSRQSFLEEMDQEAILWLASEADKNQYAWLVGDALEEYFGETKELSSFVEDLLTKDREDVLIRWKQKGLRTNIGVPSSGDSKEGEEELEAPVDEKLTDEFDRTNANTAVDESETDGPEIETLTDSETAEIDDSTSDESESHTNLASDITDISSRDTQSSTKTGSGVTQSVKGESESEISTIHEDPETENRVNNSTKNESETSTYKPRRGGSGTRPRGGKAINMPNRNQDTGHSSNGSSDMEDDAHMEETNTSLHDRKEIERIGMEHARRYEEEQGHTVEDVSAKNLGFDLRSTTLNGEIRCIEVKARADRAFVLLTSNEWSIAKELKDAYFLYVVLNAATQPELYIIQNPADEISTVEQIDVRYQVPLSEITEHGKLV